MSESIVYSKLPSPMHVLSLLARHYFIAQIRHRHRHRRTTTHATLAWPPIIFPLRPIWDTVTSVLRSCALLDEPINVGKAVRLGAKTCSLLSKGPVVCSACLTH